MTLRVALVIEGDSTDAQAAFDDLSKKAKSAQGAIEQPTRAVQGFGAALAGVRNQPQPFGSHFAQQAKVSQGAIALNTLELQNMQFQLQDIATGLSPGQSPFRVLAQQGSQIVQIFGARGAGVQGALRAVGTGIVSFITNPLNLALIGITAAAGAVDFFGRRLFSARDAAGGNEKAVTNLKEAVDALDNATGRANKTKAEEIRLSGEAVKKFLEDEIARRRLLQARLQSPLTETFASGGARGGLGDFDALRRKIERQIDEQETKIAEAQGKLREADFQRLQIGADDRLDPATQATNKYREALALLNAEVRAGNVTVAEAALRQDELIRARDRAIKAAQQAERESRKQRGRTEEERLLDDLERVRERQRQAAQGALQSVKDELDLLRETDPVMREMIRLREVLAGATNEEAAAIRGLIPELVAERAAQDAMREAREEARQGYEYLGRAAAGALDSMIARSRSAVGVLKELGVELLAAGANALLLGQGPLGGLLGGGGGGFLGAIFGGGGSFGSIGAGGAIAGTGLKIPGLSRGGQVDGPGDETSDSIPARLSRGEFVVNAKATKKHLSLLEAINQDRVRSFAGGGFVSRLPSVARASGAGFDAGPRALTVNVAGANGDREILRLVSEGVAEGLKKYDRLLPLRVRQIDSDPRYVGG